MTRQDQFYYASLVALFTGLWIQFSPAIALIVLGAIGSGVSIASSFFVTWLATKGNK